MLCAATSGVNMLLFFTSFSLCSFDKGMMLVIVQCFLVYWCGSRSKVESLSLATSYNCNIHVVNYYKMTKSIFPVY